MAFSSPSHTGRSEATSLHLSKEKGLQMYQSYSCLQEKETGFFFPGWMSAYAAYVWATHAYLSRGEETQRENRGKGAERNISGV